MSNWHVTIISTMVKQTNIFKMYCCPNLHIMLITGFVEELFFCDALHFFISFHFKYMLCIINVLFPTALGT